MIGLRMSSLPTSKISQVWEEEEEGQREKGDRREVDDPKMRAGEPGGKKFSNSDSVGEWGKS